MNHKFHSLNPGRPKWPSKEQQTMTFMSDIRNGIVCVVERDEHQATVEAWARLQQDEADNFESGQRWADNDGISFNIMNAQVVA